MKNLKFLLLFILSFTLHAKECDLHFPLKVFKPKFAKNFYINYFKDFKVVYVNERQYLLSSKVDLDCELPINKITTPAKKVIMMSTTYLPALQLLKVENSLIGFQGKRYIVSKLFNLEKIIEVSSILNVEFLFKIKPDLVMCYTSNISSENQIETFNSLKIPLVINKDFEEKTPLGRAEWLIFISSFYNQEDEAQNIFNVISDDYIKLKKANSQFKIRPKVIVGEIQNGFWTTSGGESDLAQIIADAGADMIFSKKSSTTQKISLEELSQFKIDIDYWLPQNTWRNHTEFVQALKNNTHYSLISPKINLNNIYNNNLIRNKDGFNDYWETGMQRPDLMLQELSQIFHPEMALSKKLRWYQKL